MAGRNGQSSDSDQAAVAAANSGQAAKRIKELELENGIILALKPVPPLLLREAARNIRDPEVPIWHDPDKGRDEPNPNDPDYLLGIAEAREKRSQAAMTVALLTGTAIISVPEGMYRPEQDEWIADIRAAYEIAGTTVELHDHPERARYLDWLRYYAISSETEMFVLTKLTTLGVALTNEEVQAAAESFRRVLARGANLDPAGTESEIDGDTLPA